MLLRISPHVGEGSYPELDQFEACADKVTASYSARTEKIDAVTARIKAGTISEDELRRFDVETEISRAVDEVEYIRCKYFLKKEAGQ